MPSALSVSDTSVTVDALSVGRFCTYASNCSMRRLVSVSMVFTVSLNSLAASLWKLRRERLR